MSSKDDTRQDFAKRLRALLAERSMSQSDLAAAAKIGRDSVSTYASGKTLPKPPTMRRIAQALGVEVTALNPAAVTPEPAWQMRETGQPGQIWLTVNRTLPMDTALAIIAMMREEDQRAQA